MQLIKPKILIGDDHGIIRRGISLLIQMEIGDYNITEAGTCSKVISELNKNYFTHLILDIIFPDGSALEILPNIKFVSRFEHYVFFNAAFRNSWRSIETI